MADERIVLEYDPAAAISAAGKANKAIEANEKAAEKAGAAITNATDKQATSIVSITERSQSAINRIVQQAERKAAFAGASPSDRLQMERKLALSRVAGDPSAINRVTAAYDKLAMAQEEVAKGGSKLAEFMRNPLQAAGTAVESFAVGLGKIGAIALAAGTGIAFAAKAAFDLVVAQGSAAESVSNFADTVGISATEAYKLQVQADLVGSSLETLSGGYKKLAEGIQEGSEEGKKSAAALEKMGIRIFELNGKVRSYGDLFGDIAKKIQAIEEPTTRAAKAVEVFGKSGVSLIPLLLQFDDTKAAAARAAAGINDPLIKSLADADDAIGEITAKWGALKARLAGGIVATVKVVYEAGGGDFARPFTGLGFSGSDGPNANNIRLEAEQLRLQRMEEMRRKMLADEGAALIAKYRATMAQTDTGLKERLAEVAEQRKAAEQFGSGMGAAEVQKRIDLAAKLRAEEEGITATIKARAEAEQKAEAARRAQEKGIEKAREIMAQRAAGGFKVDVIKDLEEKPVNRGYEERFREAQELSARTLEMEIGNVKERFAQEEVLYQASRDKQLAQAEGFSARTLDEKLALEQRKSEIEREYLMKSFALKAQLLEIDQRMELAKAQDSAELRNAINEKYAIAGRELALRTEAASAAAGDTAAIRSGQLVRDQAQKNFDAVQRAAEGLFDALTLRTKNWGDFLKNAVLLPALTLVKQLFSTAIAGMLTGQRGVAGGAGFGGILGGLLGGGGIARTGAPGGTGGFAGPVGGIMGLGGGGGGLGLSGLGGIGGMFLGGAALGGFGAFKAGQADNRFLKASAPAIGAVSGLVGFGALAYLFPSLLAAGPAGWIAAAGIGAAVGLIGIFKKRGEDKIVEKIKAVYGINVDRGFARNPLLPIIKDQFGGDIDAGIRSPIVRELLAVYRMQSNQASLGSGLGAINNVPRGVSLSGMGGSVYQNPVNVFGGSYTYGGSLPTSGPAQPFQRPIVIENRLQIDGRDVQAAVQRTNQASVGRRESSAVLTDPLLIFG